MDPPPLRPTRAPPRRPARPAPALPAAGGGGLPVKRSRPVVPKRRPPRRPSRPAPPPPVLTDSTGGSGELNERAELVEAVPGANSYSDESAFLTRVEEVDGLSTAQLACSLERAGIYCGTGVTKAAMQCALKAHITGRSDTATAAEVFDEFAEGRQEIGKQELSMVSATLGNLLDGDGVDDLFEDLDLDGDGSVSRAEFMIWWNADVAPNQEINRRSAALERFREEAAGWGEDELSIAEVFGRLDSDSSGTLDLSEVERLAAALGVVTSKMTAKTMFEQMDADCDGVVSLEEFESWWAAHYSDGGCLVASDSDDDSE